MLGMAPGDAVASNPSVDLLLARGEATGEELVILLASKSCRNGAWNHNTKMIIYQDASSTIANVRYPAKNKILCWLMLVSRYYH